MKRYGFLFEQIADITNIELAIQNASKGKRDRREVAKIISNKEYYSKLLRDYLLSGNYKPSPYKSFEIEDGIHHKTREIFCPKFYPDQVVHWAIMQVIQPILEQPMYHLSCGSRPNKGGKYGKKYIEKWMREDRKNTKYCLKLDISKFYPSINQSKLKEMLERKFKDKNLLKLLGSIIDSTDSGVPIGNYTSQWFANYYLTPLDHFIKEELHIKYYVRYMDDMVLFGRNKKELHKARKAISIFLEDYGLKLKDNWQVYNAFSRDVDFMGFRFFHGKTILRKSIALRIRRSIQRCKKKLNYHNACSVLSYLGWIRQADMHNFEAKYFKPYINIKKLKKVIRNANRIKYKTFNEIRC